jgi:hypothetical protein
MHCRATLEVDALPDTAHGAVPALLAVRDLGEGELGEEIGVVAGIDDPNH